MKKKCINWYDQLHELRKRLIAYKVAYRECEDAKDFQPLSQRKGELKTLLTTLQTEVMPFDEAQKEQIRKLKRRFFKNPKRHRDILERGRKELDPAHVWQIIKTRLKKNPKHIESLIKMEETGGEPDAIIYDWLSKTYTFVDCSTASPPGRRNLCYNKEGEKKAQAKGENPAGNAVDMAASMGVKILNRIQYEKLDNLGNFDVESWSWVNTLQENTEKDIAYTHLGNRCYKAYVDTCDSKGSFRAALSV